MAEGGFVRKVLRCKNCKQGIMLVIITEMKTSLVCPDCGYEEDVDN